MKATKPTQRQGFTLIELLTVITIIIVLAGLSMGAFSWAQRKAIKTRTETQMHLLSNGIAQFHADYQYYPSADGSAEGSVELGGKKTNSLFVYAMCFGDGVANNALAGGKAANGRPIPGRAICDGKPDKGATVYIDELDPNITGNTWFGKTGRPEGLLDPYGRYWYYRANHNNSVNPDYDLWSAGIDAKDEDDDIKNW